VRIISWVVAPLAIVMILGGAYLSILTRAADAEGAAGFFLSLLLDVVLVLIVLGFVALGLLVARRRPHNPVGWIVAGTGMVVLVSSFAQSYAVYALFTDPWSLPGGGIMAWLSNWTFIPVIFAAPSLLFLLFPDGHLLSRRWRPVPWVVILTSCATVTSTMLQPVLDDPPFEGVPNPLGVDTPSIVNTILSSIGWPGMAASFLVAAFAMILRLRRSRGVERQQLKWLAAAAAILPLASAASVAGYYLGFELLAAFVGPLSIIPIFLAAGYAVLRYRLYDIDVVINRTLVYGSLTLTLVLVYFGGVATIQTLFRALTGQEQQPQLAVVVSTLAIAAMFNPLRRRLQALIDRLFYRSKYDATKTLEEFSLRLREETDLDALGGGRVSLVRDTMQPTHVSLWLRPPEEER